MSLVCDLCGESQKGKGYLQRHFDRKHRLFSCGVCEGKTYRQKNNLLSHLRTHFERIICQYCGDEVLGKDKFERHLNQKHEKLELKYKCRFCVRVFPTAVHRHSHERDIHKGRQEDAFKCKDCESSFLTKEELRGHSFEHFVGRLYFCALPACDRFFKSSKQLRNHSMIHDAIPRYECEDCHKKFFQNSNLSKHKKRCKGEMLEKKVEPSIHFAESAKQQFLELGGKMERSSKIKETSADRHKEMAVDASTKDVKSVIARSYTLKTKVVNNSSTQPVKKKDQESSGDNGKFNSSDFTSTSFAAKTKAKKGKCRKLNYCTTNPTDSSSYECDTCGFATNLIYKLRRHMQQHSLPVSECGICHLKLKNVTKHMKEVHRLDRPFTCDICDSSFKTIHNLKIHKKIHETPEECPICHKFVAHLQRHMHRHSEAKRTPSHCPQCSRLCSSKQALQEHVERVHEKRPLGKSYSCLVCDLNFIRAEDLWRHSFMHYTGNVFACSFPGCNKMFKRSSKLNSHVMVHDSAKEATFGCHLCSKKYFRQTALNKHQRQTHQNCDL